MKNKITPVALSAAISRDIENFVAATTPGGIEAQEKRGQIEQSFAETLPKEGTTGESRKQFEALGFVFGENADDIFVNAAFPTGWRKKPTGHSMWSELVDDKGRKRGSIFYKAAFYDKSAHVSLNTRFGYSCYESTGVKDELSVVIHEYGKASKVIGTYNISDRSKSEELRSAAVDWLTKNYPKWHDVSAYWDLP